MYGSDGSHFVLLKTILLHIMLRSSLLSILWNNIIQCFKWPQGVAHAPKINIVASLWCLYKSYQRKC